MADHSGFVSLANKLIAKNGMEVVFVRELASGEIDLLTGKRPVAIEETRAMAVLTRPTKQELEAGRFQNASQVVLIPGDAIPAPSIADKLRFSGHDWEIVEILEVAPAGVPILYKIGVRDGGLCQA